MEKQKEFVKIIMIMGDQNQEFLLEMMLYGEQLRIIIEMEN